MHHALRNSPRPSGPLDERGTAIVEFAIVAVFLFMVLFAAVDGGFLVKARSAINNASDESARRGAVAATNMDADWQILQAVKARGLNDDVHINYVVVYKADSSFEAPPPACLGDTGTSVPGSCNRYNASALDVITSSWFGSCVNLDQSWCPDTRDGSAGSEFIGVIVDGTYQGPFGLLGGIHLQSRSVQLIEGTLQS